MEVFNHCAWELMQRLSKEGGRRSGVAIIIYTICYTMREMYGFLKLGNKGGGSGEVAKGHMGTWHITYSNWYKSCEIESHRGVRRGTCGSSFPQ